MFQMPKLPEEHVAQLRMFTDLIKEDPSILNTPELKFFKEFIESLGGKVPTGSKSSPTREFPKQQERPKPSAPEPKDVDDEEELVESDIELDNEGVIGEHSCYLVENLCKNIAFMLCTCRMRHAIAIKSCCPFGTCVLRW